ncbi:MAG TPA: hypothetical protein VMB18_18485 [Terriglobales bacterium]|nr:hypothetical protein [Terriglobales bacterium]
MRRFICWGMIVLVPASLLAQTQSAIVHTQGGVWVNGYEAKDASAVFSGDVVETRPGFSATLNLEGSSVLVEPESVVKFQGDAIELDHGGVSVETSTSFKVLVRCITVIPVASEWTQYEVVDMSGSVQVSARTKDVNVKWEHGASKSSLEKAVGQQEQGSVHQGEQKKYDESELCGAPPRPNAGTLPNPKWIAAGAAGAGVLIWCVLQCGGSKPPVSNWKP